MHLLYIDMVVTEAQTTTDEDCLLKNGQKLEEHVEDYLLLQQAALGMMRSWKEDDVLGQMLLLGGDHHPFIKFIDYTLWVCRSSLVVGIDVNNTSTLSSTWLPSPLQISSLPTTDHMWVLPPTMEPEAANMSVLELQPDVTSVQSLEPVTRSRPLVQAAETVLSRASWGPLAHYILKRTNDTWRHVKQPGDPAPPSHLYTLLSPMSLLYPSYSPGVTQLCHCLSPVLWLCLRSPLHQLSSVRQILWLHHRIPGLWLCLSLSALQLHLVSALLQFYHGLSSLMLHWAPSSLWLHLRLSSPCNCPLWD